MGRGSTVALAAAAVALLVLLPMLLLSLPAADLYEQETRRMFVEWKARKRKTYRYSGEEECRYAVFKDTRRRVARSRAAGVTSSGLNGFAATSSEEFFKFGQPTEEQSYEKETRRVFVGWKAKYGKTYRDVNEGCCRCMLFKGNLRVVVRLNAAAGRNMYDLNQFGDLTKEEVQERCYPEREDRELRARCQAAFPDPDPDPDPGPGPVHWRLIRHQIKGTVTNRQSIGSFKKDRQSIVRKRAYRSIGRKWALLEREVDRKVCRCIALKGTRQNSPVTSGEGVALLRN